MPDPNVPAWWHRIPGRCNHLARTRGGECRLPDEGTWTPLVELAPRPDDEWADLRAAIDRDHGPAYVHAALEHAGALLIDRDLATMALAQAHDAIRQLLGLIVSELDPDPSESLTDYVAGEGAGSAVWNALGLRDTFADDDPAPPALEIVPPAAWTCGRCGKVIADGEPHTDPETGDDVHDACCASCHPELAARWGIDLEVSTDDLRAAAEATMTGPAADLRDAEGRPLIAGHGTLTTDQAARGEQAATRRGDL